MGCDMFDTMTVTKTLGALCGSLLVFLLGSWAAESLYHTGGGHGEGAEQAYVIDTGTEEAAAVEDTGPDFAEVYASADPSKGEKVFNQCRACHKLEEGANATGPSLYGVVGRGEGDMPGFAYSEVLAASDETWTPDRLNAFLTSPKDYAPGTKMGYAGLKKIEDRANLIAYLSTQGGTFDPAAALPAEAAPTEAAPAEKAETSAVSPAETAAAEPATAPVAEAAPEAAPETAPAGAEQFALAGDAEAGAKVFRTCAACHKAEEGKNGVGPSLYKVVGRDIASGAGFSYSSAMQAQDGFWTPEKLDAFIAAPSTAVPGTKMPFAGIKDAAKRQDLIAYLATIGQ
jgi:cytochrome c2